MKKILVLAADYPDLRGNRKLYYIHARSLGYKERSIDVTVLNFSSKVSYKIDGIDVISLSDFKQRKNEWKVVLSHASNLRNHYIFLKKYGESFKKIFFFYHGHEVLKINKYYPQPYEYMKKNKIRESAQDIYDALKIKIWANFIKKNKHKIHMIFVSRWIRDKFFLESNINELEFRNTYSIIYNSVGQFFLNNNYNFKMDKEFDYITIRGDFDGSKYCVDIINDLAYRMPDKKFLLIGKGRYFEYNNQAPNLTVYKGNLDHDRLAEFINKSHMALMPTRQDTQGLMTCELAVFGIPVVTSDIDVCREVLEGFNNVCLVENSLFEIEKKLRKFDKKSTKYTFELNNKFSLENTLDLEVLLINEVD